MHPGDTAAQDRADATGWSTKPTLQALKDGSDERTSAPCSYWPYQVHGPLGQGTMSRVYRASLPLLGHQEYAVKLLRERCKPREVSTFLGECTKVKRLGTHPHLVPLYFAGRDRRLGRYYVVM